MDSILDWNSWGLQRGNIILDWNSWQGHRRGSAPAPTRRPI
jgi:hypothetical protein